MTTFLPKKMNSKFEIRPQKYTIIKTKTMLEELIEACSGVISPSTNVVLLADSSYSELHRWTARPSSSTSPLPVYSFTHNVVEMHRTLSTLLHKSSSNSGGKRMRLVLAVMQIDVEVLTVMQYVLSYLHQLQGCNEEEEQILDECIIFTTTHPSTIMANADLCGLLREDGGEEEDGFGLLARYLRDCGGGQDRPSTFPIRVFYTPCQALSLIPSLQSNQQDEVEEKSTDIEVRVLTSHRHRSLQPLTLSRLMRSHHFARKAEHQR